MLSYKTIELHRGDCYCYLTERCAFPIVTATLIVHTLNGILTPASRPSWLLQPLVLCRLHAPAHRHRAFYKTLSFFHPWLLGRHASPAGPRHRSGSADA